MSLIFFYTYEMVFVLFVCSFCISYLFFLHFVVQAYALSYYNNFLFSFTTDIYLLYFNFVFHMEDVSAKQESRKVKYYSCFFLFHMLCSDCKGFTCNRPKGTVPGLVPVAMPQGTVGWVPPGCIAPPVGRGLQAPQGSLATVHSLGKSRQ